MLRTTSSEKCTCKYRRKFGQHALNAVDPWDYFCSVMFVLFWLKCTWSKPFVLCRYILSPVECAVFREAQNLLNLKLV